MNKIYGFRENDLIALAKMVRDKGNLPLSKVFESYAIKSNKAKGTIRNLYYALVRLSSLDKEFCLKYLGGKPIEAKPIIEFNKDDERELVKRVLVGKKQGRSVRSVIMEMACGDGKLALRYQNKFRNAVKFKHNLVNELLAETSGDITLLSGKKEKNTRYSLDKVIREIDAIIVKEGSKISEENRILRARIKELEQENQAYIELLASKKSAKGVLGQINYTNGTSLLN
jgi:hypothetical protein